MMVARVVVPFRLRGWRFDKKKAQTAIEERARLNEIAQLVRAMLNRCVASPVEGSSLTLIFDTEMEAKKMQDLLTSFRKPKPSRWDKRRRKA